MDSSTALDPVRHLAVDRDLLTRLDDDSVADQNLLDGNVDFLAAADNARGLGLQSDQFFDGLRRATLGLDLQGKPEHDQRDDDVGHVPEHLGELHAAGRCRGQATATTEYT